MVKIDEHSVFINCPFDDSYNKLFLALISSLISVSRIPRSVLEIPVHSADRLARLCNLIAECRVSVHDLSRVGQPARFNMPFEAGLACAMGHLQPNRYGHVFLERVDYRLQKTLSDLNGRDPIVHGGSHIALINGVLGEFSARNQIVEPKVVFRIARELFDAVERRKRRLRQKTIYNRTMFKFAVATATELALEAKLIRA